MVEAFLHHVWWLRQWGLLLRDPGVYFYQVPVDRRNYEMNSWKTVLTGRYRVYAV